MRERAFKLSPDRTTFIRDTRGMSSSIAKNLGIELMALSNYLRGERHIPEGLLLALCRATSKKPADFIDDPIEKKIASAIDIY